MRYLVTGGAGFLGSHLTKRLLAKGHEVLVIDNLYSGKKSNLDKHDNLDMVQDDITREGFVNSLYVSTLGYFDGIYNLACPASPVAYQRTPIQTTLASVVGVHNLLDYISSMKLIHGWDCKFLQTSTSEVYGCPEVSPQPETYRGNVNTFGPRACYDEGKRAAEALCYDYMMQGGVDVRIARIFNTYGPNMAVDDGRVVSNFITQALRGKPITLYGNGKQTRSFCFVTDMIEALELLYESDACYPVNIGNPTEFTIEELAVLVKDKTNSSSDIVFLPLPADDPKQRRPDISLMQQKTGWFPKVDLSHGLDITIPYFENVLRRKNYDV